MRNPCAKGEVLLHQAGFELQADEAGQRSDIEFVTNAVDETPADAGIQHYTVNHPEAPARTAQMTGLLSAITSYLSVASMQVRSYAKAAFPVLMRTDFSRLYKMLSEEEKDFYCTNNAQNFIDLVQSIPFLPPINMATPVFEGGVYHNDPGADHTILNGLSKDVWIRGIARGTDLLTKRNFPVRGVRDELESIGGYGNKTDVTGEPFRCRFLSFALCR